LRSGARVLPSPYGTPYRVVDLAAGQPVDLEATLEPPE